jgi:glutathione transport system ATP-binding protein
MTAQMPPALLDVENLSVRFGRALVIDDLSFSVREGRTTAVVGESGSGKSVTSMSIMRLADMLGACYPSGAIRFRNRTGTVDLLNADQKSMRSIRGNEIAMIFQEPMTSLNPVFTIGDQLSEVLMPCQLRYRAGRDIGAGRRIR